jgi:SOS response regulatory protein OraA/RecX
MAIVTVDRTPTTGRAGRTIRLLLDGSAWLRVTPDELVDLPLSEGADLGDEARAEIEEKLSRTRARLFAVRSLAARAQSSGEIRKKLEARETPPQVIEETIELAMGYRYLDDVELAGQLARGFRDRGYGRRRAAQGLSTRLLPRDLAEEALAEAFGAADEAALATAALGSRTFGDDDAARRKAVAFLARRGFSSAVAWQVVRERDRAG